MIWLCSSLLLPLLVLNVKGIHPNDIGLDSARTDAPTNQSPLKRSTGVDIDYAHKILSQSNIPTNTTTGHPFRHVLALRFLDNVTQQQIDQVVADFSALAVKSPEVDSMYYGVNNDPEDLQQGLDHIWWLSFHSVDNLHTFISERDTVAFNDVVRDLVVPQGMGVWRCGYEATEILPLQPSVDGQIMHLVGFDLHHATHAQLHEVITAFNDLPSHISEITALEWGLNVEKKNTSMTHRSHMTHVWTLCFDTPEDRDRYLVHPARLNFTSLVDPLLSYDPLDVISIDFRASEATAAEIHGPSHHQHVAWIIGAVPLTVILLGFGCYCFCRPKHEANYVESGLMPSNSVRMTSDNAYGRLDYQAMEN